MNMSNSLYLVENQQQKTDHKTLQALVRISTYIYNLMNKYNCHPNWLTSSCVRCALRASEMLCSLWAGTPGNRSILLPTRGELPGNTSEVALTASSSVTLSESFKIDASWFAAKKKKSVLTEDLLCCLLHTDRSQYGIKSIFGSQPCWLSKHKLDIPLIWTNVKMHITKISSSYLHCYKQNFIICRHSQLTF